MSHKKNLFTKVFDGYNFDIGIDRDFQHQKVWTDKVEQTKQVQQMKQMDRIFQGIVRERIFGTIISEKSRLSNEGYFTIDKTNKTLTDSFRNTRFGNKLTQSVPISPENKNQDHSISNSRQAIISSRKRNLQPLNVKSYKNTTLARKNSIATDQSRLFELSKRVVTKDNQSIDQSCGQRSQNHSINLNFIKFPSTDKAHTLLKIKGDCKGIKRSRRQSIMEVKQMNLHKNDPFQQHFKNLSTTPGIFLYDIKLTKETVMAKTKDRVNPRLLDYFFQFFSFPPVMTFRQYQRGIERAFNSPLNIIYFFTFRVLDQSGNGFLTISDLFRFLQKYPETSYIEKEIFYIREKILEAGQQLMKLQEEKKHIKPSLEEILIVNHKLKADQVSQLLKQSIKQEINKGGQVKLTCYSQSILSLEHDVGVRLKQYELENQKNQSQAINAKNSEKDNLVVNQDGLRFTNFCQIFCGRRPKIFCMLVNILTGMSNAEYE